MTSTPSHLLVLGGGSFVGAAIVDEACSRGWSITCLSRGILPLANEVEIIAVDRTDPSAITAALADIRPDYIVDTWAGAPSVVTAAANALARTDARVGYISSRSVYAELPSGADETQPTVEADPDAQSRSYPEDKRGGELAWERAVGRDRVAHFRPGAIVGPRDNHGRLVWWLGRLAEGGQVLAPGPREAPLQYIDVRDLAAFTLSALEAGHSGAFDTVTDPSFATMGSLLADVIDAIDATADGAARPPALVWVDEHWLLDRGVEPWREVPFWAPPDLPVGGLHSSNTAKAIAAGLTFRPTRTTVDDTWASIRDGATASVPRAAGLGMTRERERQLLAEWTSR